MKFITIIISLIMGSQFALGSAGTKGGGDMVHAPKGTPFQPGNVDFYVLKDPMSKFVPRDALQGHQWVYTTGGDNGNPVLLSADRKLYGRNQEGKTVYEVLQGISAFTAKGQCIDIDGKVHDASATTKGICYDSWRIAPSTDTMTYYTDIAPLTIHELSHYMGTHEDEAWELEKAVREELHNGETYDFPGAQGNISENLTRLVDEIKQIRKLVANSENSDTCAYLDSNYMLAQAYLVQQVDWINQAGGSSLSVEGMEDFQAIVQYTALLKAGFCLTSKSKLRNKLEEDLLKNGGDLRAMGQILGKKKYPALLLPTGDHLTLDIELGNLQMRVKDLKADEWYHRTHL